MTISDDIDRDDHGATMLDELTAYPVPRKSGVGADWRRRNGHWASRREILETQTAYELLRRQTLAKRRRDGRECLRRLHADAGGVQLDVVPTKPGKAERRALDQARRLGLVQ